MKIQIPINISVITDFDEHMSPEEEIFFKEQFISMFAENPHPLSGLNSPLFF